MTTFAIHIWLYCQWFALVVIFLVLLGVDSVLQFTNRLNRQAIGWAADQVHRIHGGLE